MKPYYSGYLAPYADAIRELYYGGAAPARIAEALFDGGVRAQYLDDTDRRSNHVRSMQTIIRKCVLKLPSKRRVFGHTFDPITLSVGG